MQQLSRSSHYTAAAHNVLSPRGRNIKSHMKFHTTEASSYCLFLIAILNENSKNKLVLKLITLEYWEQQSLEDLEDEFCVHQPMRKKIRQLFVRFVSLTIDKIENTEFN